MTDTISFTHLIVFENGVVTGYTLASGGDGSFKKAEQFKK